MFKSMHSKLFKCYYTKFGKPGRSTLALPQCQTSNVKVRKNHTTLTQQLVSINVIHGRRSAHIHSDAHTFDTSNSKHSTVYINSNLVFSVFSIRLVLTDAKHLALALLLCLFYQIHSTVCLHTVESLPDNDCGYRSHTIRKKWQKKATELIQND